MPKFKGFLEHIVEKATSNKAFLQACFTIFCSVTPRPLATEIYTREAGSILSMAKSVGVIRGKKRIKIPKMPGIDEDMRDWSIYMTLEHMVITNEMTRRIIDRLAREKAFTEAFDMKKDVMPSAGRGPEQIEKLERSVRKYLSRLSGLENLRSVKKYVHCIFGSLSAHGWHCMSGFHFHIHRKQIEILMGR